MWQLFQVAFVITIWVGWEQASATAARQIQLVRPHATTATRHLEPNSNTTSNEQSCSNNDDCPHMKYCDTSLSKCLCYLKYLDGQCTSEHTVTARPVNRHRIPCSDSRQCGHNAHCDRRTSRCECNRGFVYHHDQYSCVPEDGPLPDRIDEHCFLHDHHSDSCGRNAICNKSFHCVCLPGYVPSHDLAHCVRELGMECRETAYPGNCGSGAECQKEAYGFRHFCQCPQWTKPVHRVHCEPSVKQCHEQNQCHENEHCNEHSGQCVCNIGCVRSGNRCKLQPQAQGNATTTATIAAVSSAIGCAFVLTVIFVMNRRMRRKRSPAPAQHPPQPSPASVRVPSAPELTPQSSYTMPLSRLSPPNESLVELLYDYQNHPYYHHHPPCVGYHPPPGYQPSQPHCSLPSEGKIDFD